MLALRNLRNGVCYMKKFLCVLILALFLAACDELPDLHEIPETTAGIWDATQPFQPGTWQYAYAGILLQHAEATTDLEPDELWRFVLFDINQDGVPELIIWEALGTFLFLYNAYTFSGGQAIPLETSHPLNGRVWNLSATAPPDSMPGMIVSGGGERGFQHLLMRMEGHTLYKHICALLLRSPWDRGYHDSLLFYVHGIEAAAIELPAYLYWLEDEHDELLYQGYALVTQEEFYRIRYTYFGIASEQQGPLTQALTKPDILREISLWSSQQ